MKAKDLPAELPPGAEVTAVNPAALGLPAKRRRERSKYRNVPTEVGGLRFDSRKEARRWLYLCGLARAGVIVALRRQVSFALRAPALDGRVFVAERYRADFVYVIAATGERVVEDTKGARTRDYRRKKRWMRLQHGIEVREV